MSLSIDNSIHSYLSADMVSKYNKADQLSGTLENKDLSKASDEELMDVCRSFEAYFVEQVFKEMKKSVHSESDNSEYMQYFGDTLIEAYAEEASKGNGLGIAKMLYESMKR